MAKPRNGRAADDDDVVEEVPPSEEEEGEGEEEEFEIEAILDAKQDAFEGGKLGYLVKWKGYDIEQNSWVSEDDAINCQDLIDAYWNEQKKKTGQKKAPAPAPASAAPRKSQVTSAASTKPNSTAGSRKRTTPDEEPETISAPPKKRGRPTKPAKPASESEDDAPVKAPAKRGRPSTQNARKGSDAMDEDEEVEYFDMKTAKYRDLDSWENIIDHVDTVERRDDGKLIVYFKLNKKHGNKLCREESRVCREKFPNLLLDFYEHNLRWRPFTE